MREILLSEKYRLFKIISKYPAHLYTPFVLNFLPYSEIHGSNSGV